MDLIPLLNAPTSAFSIPLIYFMQSTSITNWCVFCCPAIVRYPFLWFCFIHFGVGVHLRYRIAPLPPSHCKHWRVSPTKQQNECFMRIWKCLFYGLFIFTLCEHISQTILLIYEQNWKWDMFFQLCIYGFSGIGLCRFVLAEMYFRLNPDRFSWDMFRFLVA